MPELCFALFVKRLLALLTGVLFACLICSRLFLKFRLGKPAHPPGMVGRPPAHPNEQLVFLWRQYAFVEYGTAARNHNMPELCFALFIKHTCLQNSPTTCCTPTPNFNLLLDAASHWVVVGKHQLPFPIPCSA